ncbi:hypothetical protein [Streptomyces sp. C3-3]|uniref:hypothetical protein n=1 Tax=Streptomyces sp. C3-3 TaxID=2824901 RepID=UPI001FFC544A|nr:hypothetical protein [Streptomyces sp. C3-3]
MEIRPLSELRAADKLSLAFNPYGLGGRMKPEDAAEFQQRQIADCDLAEGVAAGTCDSFKRLRTVFAYGVLCYDVYTVVGDQALHIYEQALRDRFLEWCADTITFRPPHGPDVSCKVTSYDDVKKRADKMTRERSKLVVAAHAVEFNGMLHGLRLWARAAGLLCGRRSRAVEDALAKLRNHVAHPSGHHVDTPSRLPEPAVRHPRPRAVRRRIPAPRPWPQLRSATPRRRCRRAPLPVPMPRRG